VLNYDYFQQFSNTKQTTRQTAKQTAGKQQADREKRNTNEIQMKETSKEQRYKLKIIFLYASKKNINLQDPAKKQSFIKRNLRPAEDLVPYELARIEEVMDFLEAHPSVRGNQKWSLETIAKFIDEDLTKLKVNEEEINIPSYAKQH
jgi:hypothetical protein